ncbi:hypothetical protein ST37_07300 [Vibrio sp. qd031]|nr:hypothetical protein ST37_07300 [Vibrio sp. qd031]
MWQQDFKVLCYKDAIEFAKTTNIGGYNDWRLPTIKELQAIVDYTRSPQATNSAAIDPIFSISTIKDEQGNARDYPNGHGPQGDVIRIDNYVRPVRHISQ